MSDTNGRKIFRAGAEAPDPPRYEWVSLDKGDVCVWEMTAADSVRVIDRIQRPGGQPATVTSAGLMSMYQIMNSCYDRESHEPGAQRIFGDADLQAIYDLKFHEWDALTDAINRLCGKDAGAEERLRDFTKATEALNPSA